MRIYVRPFVASGSSGPSLGEGKWQVSKDGGTNAKWRADGKEMIFNFALAMMSVDVNGSGAGFQMGPPSSCSPAPANNGWDVTSDGKRFMMIVPPNQGMNNLHPHHRGAQLAGGFEEIGWDRIVQSLCPLSPATS